MSPQFVGLTLTTGGNGTTIDYNYIPSRRHVVDRDPGAGATGPPARRQGVRIHINQDTDYEAALAILSVLKGNGA